MRQTEVHHREFFTSTLLLDLVLFRAWFVGCQSAVLSCDIIHRFIITLLIRVLETNKSYISDLTSILWLHYLTGLVRVIWCDTEMNWNQSWMFIDHWPVYTLTIAAMCWMKHGVFHYIKICQTWICIIFFYEYGQGSTKQWMAELAESPILNGGPSHQN